MIALASALERNHSIARHSSRKRPLKLSFVPFCQGFPGSMNAVSILSFGSPKFVTAIEWRLVR
jgi:hypothetical protein